MFQPPAPSSITNQPAELVDNFHVVPVNSKLLKFSRNASASFSLAYPPEETIYYGTGNVAILFAKSHDKGANPSCFVFLNLSDINNSTCKLAEDIDHVENTIPFTRTNESSDSIYAPFLLNKVTARSLFWINLYNGVITVGAGSDAGHKELGLFKTKEFDCDRITVFGISRPPPPPPKEEDKKEEHPEEVQPLPILKEFNYSASTSTSDDPVEDSSKTHQSKDLTNPGPKSIFTPKNIAIGITSIGILIAVLIGVIFLAKHFSKKKPKAIEGPSE